MQEWPIQTKFKHSFPHLELPIFLIFEQTYSVFFACLQERGLAEWLAEEVGIVGKDYISWKLHVSSMFLCVFTPVERGQC